MKTLIQQLMDEHQIILSFLDGLEDELVAFMEEDIFIKDTYMNALSFIRNTADKAHHQREEQILFRHLLQQGNPIAINIIQQGMLVEHDYARFYCKELEKSVQQYDKEHKAIDKLTILSNAKAYCELLRRHIDKEDRVVYPFALRTLSEETLFEMEKENMAYNQAL